VYGKKYILIETECKALAIKDKKKIMIAMEKKGPIWRR